MVWSIQSDGNELNSIATGGNFACRIPELQYDFDMDPVLAQIDGDYPVVIRLQPREGRYTFLINSKACDDATWQTRLAQLKSWLSVGPHTFVVQVRGMSSSKTFKAVIVSTADDFRGRTFTAIALAPKPVLT